MKAIMKYLLVAALTLACSAAWSFDFEEEFKKAIKDGVQQKIEEKSDAATSSALMGFVGISQEQEITIGRQIAGNLLGASALVKDRSLQIYVNNVGRWVASQGERPELAWHFGVIESSDVNAFAAPGGYIFLTRGLYSLLQNEAELAGVLGHEIGHVIRKHHLKILQQSSLVDLGGRLLSKQIGGSDKVQKLIGNGAEIVARSLDKNAEFEADRIAVVLAARAGYGAFALPEVLQQIGHFAKDDGSVALLFKTHPHPDDRLEKLGLAMSDRLEDVKGKTLVARFYRIKP